MKFNERARLDSSQVRTRKGGGKAAVGGGAGILGVLVLLAVQFLGGGGGGGDLQQVLEQLNGRQVGAGQATTAEVEGCETGADANESEECRIVAVVNSIQDYWSTTLNGYELAPTNFFTGSVTTGGCGSASSNVGPFYCPADKQIYIDLEFFDSLIERLGGSTGDFAQAYVFGHEYGHHVQNLLGLNTNDRSTGPDSPAVRQELQADCLAGLWAHHATTTPDPDTGEILILELTDQDIAEAIQTAKAIGDDSIQEMSGGRVNPESWTHGSSAQREASFRAGFESGDPGACGLR